MPRGGGDIKMAKNKKKSSKKRKSKKRLDRSRVGRAVPMASSVDTVVSAPRFTGRGPIVEIAHEEHVIGLTTESGAYNATYYEYFVNAGDSACFPWLSTIALRFEWYRFLKLEFIYRGCCPATTTGLIYLAIDTDSEDPAGTYDEMVQYEGCKQTVPYAAECRVPILPHQLNYVGNSAGWRFTEAYGGAQHGALHDVGLFQICDLLGAGGGAIHGQLWVRYVVQLKVPQIQTVEAGDKDAQAEAVVEADSGNGYNLWQVTDPVDLAALWKHKGFPGVDLTTHLSGGQTRSYLRFNRPGEYIVNLSVAGSYLDSSLLSIYTPGSCGIGILDIAYDGIHWSLWSFIVKVNFCPCDVCISFNDTTVDAVPVIGLAALIISAISLVYTITTDAVEYIYSHT